MTPLQTRVAQEIVSLARREDFKAGQHLPEALLSERIGTSRSPINAAMRHLKKLGVVAHDKNRGFFMQRNATDLGDVMRKFAATPDDPLYLRIAADRQAGRLGEAMTEAELMRRYGVARSNLLRALSRIQKEGWIERNLGHGWSFVPMIESQDSYEESYLFRVTIEPAGMLSPSFNADPGELSELRREQMQLAGESYKSMTPVEIFEANARFHETVARWSGNRFFVQSLERINNLRRLVEYNIIPKRPPRVDEHLEILDAIGRQDMLTAASLMRAHLDVARRVKKQEQGVFPTP